MAFAAQRLYSSLQTQRFIAHKKAEFSGYRLQHLERERLLFLHLPDSTRRDVALAELRSVYLYRLSAADATNNQDHYFWVMDGPPIAITIPYFSVDPSVVVGILKKEHPEIDTERSMQRAREFEHDKFNFCTIWAVPGSAEISPEKGYKVCAPVHK